MKESTKHLYSKMHRVGIRNITELIGRLGWSWATYFRRMGRLKRNLRHVEQLCRTLDISMIEFMEDVLGYENTKIKRFMGYLEKEYGAKTAEAFLTAYNECQAELYEQFAIRLVSFMLKRDRIEQNI